MTLFFSFVLQGETKLKITLDRTAPMIITVELMALFSHQMHLFCQIIKMRVSVLFLDFRSSYFITFCPGVIALCHFNQAVFSAFSVLVITSLQRTTICFIEVLILLGNSILLVNVFRKTRILYWSRKASLLIFL